LALGKELVMASGRELAAGMDGLKMEEPWVELMAASTLRVRVSKVGT